MCLGECVSGYLKEDVVGLLVGIGKGLSGFVSGGWDEVGGCRGLLVWVRGVCQSGLGGCVSGYLKGVGRAG